MNRFVEIKVIYSVIHLLITEVTKQIRKYLERCKNKNIIHKNYAEGKIYSLKGQKGRDTHRCNVIIRIAK